MNHKPVIQIIRNAPVIAMVLLIGYLVSGTTGSVTPAFDSAVSASSSVSNMQQLAYESTLRSSAIGDDGLSPGEVHYMVSISGVNGTPASGFVRTAFAVSSLEGRDTLLNASSVREWRDKTEIAGTIANFRKMFDYGSGIRL